MRIAGKPAPTGDRAGVPSRRSPPCFVIGRSGLARDP